MTSPPNSPPAFSDLEWVERHWKTIGVLIAVLGAAGYTVLSPGQKVEALGAKIEKATELQALRDKGQDDRIDRIQTATDVGLREVRDDIRDLLIAECIRSTNQAVRARLRCSERANGGR